MELGAEVYKDHIIVKGSRGMAIINTLTSDLFYSENKLDSVKTEIDKGKQGENRDLNCVSPENVMMNSITVCVTEKCNMKCTYCYANEGTYNNKNDDVMNKEDFEKVREVIWDLNSKGIKSIHFFGGEPLLVTSELFDFCEQIRDDYKVRNIIGPSFSITTNGTLIDAKTADNLSKYDFTVCISLDGPEEMNNYCRQFKDGSGTFQNIIRGKNYLQEKGIKVVAEATIGIKQLKEFDGKENYDFFDFFAEQNFEAVGFFMDITNDIIDVNLSTNFYNSLVDYYFGVLLCNKADKFPVYTNVLSIILQILSNKDGSYCLAGLTQIFLTSKGGIYPCQTYYACQKNKMGNIYSLDIYKNERNDLVKTINERIPKECKSCSYNKYCPNMCPGSNLLSTGEENLINSTQCFSSKKLIDRVIYNLCFLVQDQEKMSRFEHNLDLVVKKAGNFDARIFQ